MPNSRTTQFNILHNAEEHRFEFLMESHLAQLDYYIRGNTIIFTHTGVPPELEGRGVGSALVKAGLGYARVHRLKVQTTCWFVRGYLKRHPEYQNLK